MMILNKNNTHNQKKRLFEIFQKVNNINLNESLLSKDKKIEIINLFIKFVDDKLKFGDNLPNITISSDENEAKEMHSFGKCTPEDKEVHVVIANRNLADILRTLAHELVHYRQYLKGQLTSKSNKTGSSDENEANAFAGILMREFGKKYPIIFE